MKCSPALKLTYLCVISLCFHSTLQGEEPLRMRVLCYNIHHAEGIDRKLDVERIANVILSVKPDLVALQEVDKTVKRTQNVDQPEELSRLTGMHVAFGANIELQGGHYGNAILSRFPISHQTNHLLPNFDDGEQRGVLETQLQVPNRKTPLVFLSTHFDSRRDHEERNASSRFINDWVQKNNTGTALLAGDFNAVISSQCMKTIQKEWTVSNSTPLPSVPVKTPNRQIDFILFRPQTGWNVIETRILEEQVASDHRAIFSILELTE